MAVARPLTRATCAGLNAPVIFCPQPTLATLSRDIGELWNFVIATPDWSVRTAKIEMNKTTEQSLRAAYGDMRSTLYEFWLKGISVHKRAGCLRRIMIIFYDIAKMLLFLSVIYASMIDYFWDFVAFFLLNCALWDTWRLLRRPTSALLVVLFVWILSPFMRAKAVL